jgi:anaerobic selenocysteine-containing dehydrogenase
VTSVMKPSLCRMCPNSCVVIAHVENDRQVRITGRAEGAVFLAACIKDQAQLTLMYRASRLRHSVRRSPQGSFFRRGLQWAR